MLVSTERPAKHDGKFAHRTFQIPFGPGLMENIMVIRPPLEENMSKYYMVPFPVSHVPMQESGSVTTE